MIINSKFISLTDVAKEIGIHPETIKRWYRWLEDEDFDFPNDLHLPDYFYTDLSKQKYFLKTDVDKLKEFHKKINTTHFGVMSEFNAFYQWGRRGKKVLKNKELAKEKNNAN